MTTRQLRIRLDALKRKYTVPFPILRLRRAEILCHNWETAEANNKPLPDTPMMVTEFAQNGGPHIPSYGEG